MPDPSSRPLSRARLDTAARFVAYRVLRWLCDRVDRVRPRPPPFDGVVPAPDRVTLETTRYCNLKCRMCLPYLDGITVTGPHMELERFRRYAEELFPFATRFQPSVSGEPTMTKDFAEMIALARKFGVKMEITTNGTLLNRRMVDALLPVLGEVSVSVDGATAETFEFIREGARFDRVIDNVRYLLERVRELPESRRPVVGIACTLMEKNVRELPAMVELAHRLGLDFVCASHVMPATDEMRRQSLVHHQDLARACIEAAVAAARRLGVRFTISPLDQIIAATAAAPGDRALAAADGAVPGLDEALSVGPEHHGPPVASAGDPDFPSVQENRRRGRQGARFAPRRPPARFPRREEPIWVCDYLWNQTFVHVEGEVRPCCVTGPPVLGNLDRQRFDEIWNGDAYRVMRQRLIARDPVAVCKGCQFIKEIRDPKQTDRWLHGKSVPSASELLPVPPLLEAPPAPMLPTGAAAASTGP